MDELKKQAAELGIKVDGRWSAERLQAEIDEALEKDPVDVGGLVEANAEIQSDIQARFDAGQIGDKVSDIVVPVNFSTEIAATLVNLQANPMKVLGLKSYGETTVTVAQMADPRFSAKVKRAAELGMIMVKAGQE